VSASSGSDVYRRSLEGICSSGQTSSPVSISGATSAAICTQGNENDLGIMLETANGIVVWVAWAQEYTSPQGSSSVGGPQPQLKRFATDIAAALGHV
jgi:hypothetical protein